MKSRRGSYKVDEVVYDIWDFVWGDNWFLYELGEADDGFYCRCVDAHSWETLALGVGDSPTQARARAFRELVALAGRKPPGSGR
jgi:hypothetical protein